MLVIEGQDVAAGRERRHRVSVPVVADGGLRDHLRGGGVARLRQHPQSHAERDRGRLGHAGELPTAHHPHDGEPSRQAGTGAAVVCWHAPHATGRGGYPRRLVPGGAGGRLGEQKAGVRVSGTLTAFSRLRGSMGVVSREVAKFGAVGAVAFVVNVGLFNLLSAGPLDGHEKLSLIIASAVSIVVAWFGSRYWTFRHREQRSRGAFITFVVMNVIGAAIAVVCLAISHDLLGLDSLLADNISGNVIGVGLGTLFRFWAYRTFVFTEFLDPEARDRAEDPAALPLPVVDSSVAEGDGRGAPLTATTPAEPPQRAAG